MGWSLGVLLLSGCASRMGSVDQRLLLPDGASRYDMAPHQAFVLPVPKDNAPPSFPEPLALRELPPTTVCVSFIIDAQGNTVDARPLEQPGCTTGTRFARLHDAAVSTVSGWRFTPAMFCDYPDAATRDRDWNGNGCAGDRVEARVVPVSLAYAFTFEVRDGKRRVVSAKR